MEIVPCEPSFWAAGTLGSLIGGGLARIGCDVTLLGRGPHIKAIREEGLRVTGLQDYTVQVSAITQPQTLDACDLLVVTVKAHDTAKALHSVEHLVAQTIVVSFQNSVTKDAQLADVFGPQRVLGGASILEQRDQRRPVGGCVWAAEGAWWGVHSRGTAAQGRFCASGEATTRLTASSSVPSPIV